MLKSLLQRFVKPSSPAPGNSSPETPESEIAALPNAGENGAKEVEPPLGIGDALQKMEAARCDLHPLYRLREAGVAMQASQGTNVSRVKPVQCTKTTCNRHYVPEFGYFGLAAGEAPNFGDLEGKPNCGSNHERRFLVVSKVNDDFLWVCPEPGCTTGVPYQEP